jgi:hypothetical protein
MWVERAQTYDAMMQREEVSAQVAARRERAARQIKIARRMQDLASDKLMSPKFAKKLSQPRDIAMYARTGIAIEREVCGDAKPPEPQPPIQFNLFAQIKFETDRMRTRILQEFVEQGRLTQQQADILRERGAQQPLFATSPASEVIDAASHPSDASCSADPSVQPAPRPEQTTK